MKYLVIIFLFLCSCQTQKQWSKKGFERGWVDTATVKVYDTIQIKGSSRDTLFYGSVDTLYMGDKNFTTVYYKDSVTQKIYLKTVVFNRDTTIIKEVHTTTLKEIKYSFVDHLKAVWYVWMILFILLLILAVMAVIKK